MGNSNSNEDFNNIGNAFQDLGNKINNDVIQPAGNTANDKIIQPAGWSLSANVNKYGAAGSNTQNYQEMGVVIGATHGGMGVAGTLTLNEAAPIIVAITLNSATTASDSSLWQLEINATN